MKILHLNEHLDLKGGVETYLFAVIPRLENYGIESHVAYGYKSDAGSSGNRYYLPAVSETGFTSVPKGKSEFRKLAGEIKPDVIHIHNVQNIGIVQAALEYGPMVMTTHDYRWACPANSFFYKRTQKICGRQCGPGCFTTTLTKHCLTPRPQYAAYFYYRTQWVIKNAGRFSHVISPSHGAMKRYLAAGYPEERISVLPYFCSLEPREKPRDMPEKSLITFLGRVAPNKGHEHFIEALGLLPSDVRGLFVGGLTEESESSLKILAEKHHCADRLEFYGWASRDEVIDIMDRTSVFIFPSLWPETLGIVGIEALSRGVPVVASDVGGVAEWCIDGETGFRVPPGDSAAIAEGVKQILTDSGNLDKFGRNGIELIRDKFMPVQHTDRLIEIYKNIQTCA